MAHVTADSGGTITKGGAGPGTKNSVGGREQKEPMAKDKWRLVQLVL